MIRRGDVDFVLAESPFRLSGELEIGGQDHFYLETQAALAEPGEDGAIRIVSSTQHPSEVQQIAAHVLKIAAHKVVVECSRMGGGFGGKETQAAIPAALAASAASRTRRRVRVRYGRDQDMIITGKRHPFFARYEAGFDSEGNELVLQVGVYFGIEPTKSFFHEVPVRFRIVDRDEGCHVQLLMSRWAYNTYRGS